jgi:hypothetical protein
LHEEGAVLVTSSLMVDALSLGALTGLRSMAGPAALAQPHGGRLSGLTGALALGEMILDKTSVVGNRIDAGPLAGRAIIGALVGGLSAKDGHASRVLGGALGASAAIVAAHTAFRARTRSPLPNALNGVLEDALVASLIGWFDVRLRRRSSRLEQSRGA